MGGIPPGKGEQLHPQKVVEIRTENVSFFDRPKIGGKKGLFQGVKIGPFLGINRKG